MDNVSPDEGIPFEVGSLSIALKALAMRSSISRDLGGILVVVKVRVVDAGEIFA